VISGGFRGGGGGGRLSFPNRGAVATNMACSRARSLRHRLPPPFCQPAFRVRGHAIQNAAKQFLMITIIILIGVRNWTILIQYVV